VNHLINMSYMLIFLQQTEPRKYDILGLLSYLFWIIMILFLVIPYIKQKKLNTDRFRQIRKIERNRGSRVITMIHRQERLLGLPFFKYIDIQDSEQVLRAIRMTPTDMPIVYPASSILKVVEKKKMDEIDDRTLILADVATKAVKQMRKRILEIIGNRMDLKNAKELANTLTSGKWTHDYPITFKEAKELGFNVRKDIPKDIYKLMDLYPQPSLGRPSVQYIPIPYPRERKR